MRAIDRADSRVNDQGWLSYRLHVPVDEIGYVASVLEAYDNQFLIRTETAGVGVVRIWFPSCNRGLLDEVLREMSTEFPVSLIAVDEGMAGLDEVYPDESV